MSAPSSGNRQESQVTYKRTKRGLKITQHGAPVRASRISANALALCAAMLDEGQESIEATVHRTDGTKVLGELMEETHDAAFGAHPTVIAELSAVLKPYGLQVASLSSSSAEDAAGVANRLDDIVNAKLASCGGSWLGPNDREAAKLAAAMLRSSVEKERDTARTLVVKLNDRCVAYEKRVAELEKGLGEACDVLHNIGDGITWDARIARLRSLLHPPPPATAKSACGTCVGNRYLPAPYRDVDGTLTDACPACTGDHKT